ncbi:MAG: hypothetical protein BV457_01225 [Thermoplasmata archaeon M9B1D]|nr:MAG: hypothetical protein BV457_01225 [Thermoplasmata archaeon M9B1D]PNX50624.1 MAG: hypothetical protein BV456_06065 [Thermoplasmata archaeon M8B2D]
MISIIVIIGVVLYIFFLLNDNVAKAQLVIESGIVQVKHGDESWIPAENGMLLYQSDYVKTGENTSASIILFESSIIRLDSNTELFIKEILQEAGRTTINLEQNAGRTWNTVLKVSGIDDYDIQTPTTVASVRGTSFDVNQKVGNTTNVGVGSGTVIISSLLNGEIIDTIEANRDEAVKVDPELIDQNLEIIPFEKDEWVLLNQQLDEEFKKGVKEDFYDRIQQYIPELKEIYGVTDDELEILVDGYINGYVDLPEETPDWIREIIELS